MYFPYLRGKQYELLALKELLAKNLISDRVIPIIEPIKGTKALNDVLSSFLEKSREIAIIQNPNVGDYDFATTTIPGIDYLRTNPNYIHAYLITDSPNLPTPNTNNKSLYIFSDDITTSVPEIVSTNAYLAIPDNASLRRKFSGRNLILLTDPFNKRPRNSDYLQIDSEAFSNNNIFYKKENYIGFGDYSIIGSPFNEGGFAPVAVSMHIVYRSDDDDSLMIKHFTSDTNDDYNNPAQKFGEALTKFVEWYTTTDAKNQTYAGNQLLTLNATHKYPGLGVLKKLSLMHHLEIVSKFLSEKEEI